MEDYCVWVNGGSLLLIAPDVLPDQRQAVLDSVLYAQLVANKFAGSRFSNYQTWYERYRNTLTERDWIFTKFHHESKSASDCSLLSVIQPLQLWLETRHTGASAIIDQGIAALTRDAQGLECFGGFTFEARDTGAVLIMEIGLVHPGPVIDLCGISITLVQAPEVAGIEQSLAGEVLCNEVVINGGAAVLDGKMFEGSRADLRSLMARKQQEHNYVMALDSQPEGDNHE
ncbi:hypothetical protein [Pseudomonas donghuensis]|uniref:hypothetical protein n=1 Tax=Pseudomonas donghuensis TaxID=1163398 RepID=UPI000C2A3D20|nr:hypothetical protein [Pseudomonas donghuensis]PJY95062.1 hypothetical protein COO64_18215 [Pseudomonas donghuensis]WKY28941.1 hypothetical protein QYF67_02785 [Pseudomonas donghuensis]